MHRGIAFFEAHNGGAFVVIEDAGGTTRLMSAPLVLASPRNGEIQRSDLAADATRVKLTFPLTCIDPSNSPRTSASPEAD